MKYYYNYLFKLQLSILKWTSAAFSNILSLYKSSLFLINLNPKSINIFKKYWAQTF